MRNLFFFIISIFISCAAFAQSPAPSTAKPAGPIVIGYFNYDSIRALLPGYQRQADAAMANSELADMKKELERKRTEYDSLESRWSKSIRAIKEMEINDLAERIANYDKSKITFNTSSYDLQLTEAAHRIAIAKGYAAALDSKNAEDFIAWSAPNIEFRNITTEICAELGIRR